MTYFCALATVTPVTFAVRIVVIVVVLRSYCNTGILAGHFSTVLDSNYVEHVGIADLEENSVSVLILPSAASVLCGVSDGCNVYVVYVDNVIVRVLNLGPRNLNETAFSKCLAVNRDLEAFFSSCSQCHGRKDTYGRGKDESKSKKSSHLVHFHLGYLLNSAYNLFYNNRIQYFITCCNVFQVFFHKMLKK